VRYKELIENLYEDMKGWIMSNGKSGLIYCHKREDCDDIATRLVSDSINAAAYHAGLKDAQREETLKLWTNNKIDIIVATIAFGMGIDKPDVRFVVHYHVPKSIEGTIFN